MRGICSIQGALAIGAVAFGLSASAQAGGNPLPKVIFSNIAASPTSDVPGLPGVKFNPGTATQFDRPFVSPDGSRWVIGAATNLPAAENEVVIVGVGQSGAGAMVIAREGTATFFDGMINYGTINTQMGINNAGEVAFTADTTAATTVDQVCVRWDNPGFTLIAREGTQAPEQPAGVGYGSSINAAHILEGGEVRFRTASLTGATTQQVLYRSFAIDMASVMAQTDITIPAGQLFMPEQSIDNLTSDRFRSDATGANYIYHGDLNGATTTDLFMVVNDTIVAQEGAPLPGSGFAANVAILSGDAGSQQMSPYNGIYAFRGNNNDGTGATATDWVSVSGVVVAQTDQPIHAGATEIFDDAPFATTFFNNTVNSFNQWIIGGTTNAANTAANAVLVRNSKWEVVRENDPVDLDGNGIADDDVFISVFNNDDSFLTPGLNYYFCADLRNGVGMTIGQALLVVSVRLNTGDMNCDGIVSPSDIAGFVLALTDPTEYANQFPNCDIENGDTNNDGIVTAGDIAGFVALLTSN